MLPEGLMRKVPPGGTSPQRASPGRVSPAEKGAASWPCSGRSQLQRPGSNRKTNGNLEEGGALRQCGLMKRTVIIIIMFRALFIWEWKDWDSIGLKCQKLGYFQPPLWCFSRTHMEGYVVAASGKGGAALDPGCVFSHAWSMEQTWPWKVYFCPPHCL